MGSWPWLHEGKQASWASCSFRLHSGLQVSPFATRASPVSSVDCILDAEPLAFRITLAVHRLPCSERRHASAASREDPGWVWEEEMLEVGFCGTRTRSSREVLEDAGPCSVF